MTDGCPSPGRGLVKSKQGAKRADHFLQLAGGRPARATFLAHGVYDNDLLWWVIRQLLQSEIRFGSPLPPIRGGGMVPSSCLALDLDHDHAVPGIILTRFSSAGMQSSSQGRVAKEIITLVAVNNDKRKIMGCPDIGGLPFSLSSSVQGPAAIR